MAPLHLGPYGLTGRTDSTWPSPKRKLDNIDASGSVLASKWKTLWKAMRADIHKAQVRQKKWYDQKHMKAPELKAGDNVMLGRRNIITKWPSNKLDQKKLGPFEVVEKLGVAS
ncbi:uncharacterized protein LAJ45_11194 [Morchella importuna]|uniref:uncharacterized protein n=1 Tax=Morchella importuna TaxID=1174673 RepID=UPI001E8CCF68|nr:uncharacterized protein LAJ45_11213 [Morchella importuna]XP_045966102.1 uncharacterized protein LAJ45_11194 [Morchella importuna]KAH8144778.1 hypothetical protein LAJ45_11213 [Morchella importuna]KAH8144798.1 hypothetical protein LAJ45_11194 [Morchella importuna]